MKTKNDLTPGRALVLSEIKRLAEIGVSDATGGELNRSLVERGLIAAGNPSAHRRARELVERGLLADGPRRKCKVTGELVTTYKLPTVPTRIGRMLDIVANLSGSGSSSASMEIATEMDRTTDILTMLDALIAI